MNTEQFMEYLHLARRKNQLKIVKYKIFDLQQELGQLEEKLWVEVKQFDHDERDYWYKWGLVKHETPPEPESELVALAKEFNISTEELAALVREELVAKS